MGYHTGLTILDGSQRFRIEEDRTHPGGVRLEIVAGAIRIPRQNILVIDLRAQLGHAIQPAIGGQRERQIMLMQVIEQIQIGRRDTHQHHRFTVRHRTVKEGDDFIELESMLVEEHTAAFAAAALHGLGKVARQGGVLVHVPCRRNHGDADTLSIRHDEMTERHNH